MVMHPSRLHATAVKRAVVNGPAAVADKLIIRKEKRRSFLVIEPQALVRHGLALSLLASYPDVCTHQAASVKEAVASADHFDNPDVIILDIDGLPDPDAAIRRLRHVFACPVLVTCSRADVFAGRDRLLAGAASILLKTEPGAVLKHTIALILSGEGYLALPAWVLDGGQVAPQAEAPDRMSRLTARQREIFSLLLSGCSNKEIARKLGVLEGTVKVHVRAMMQKLGATNRTQVAVMAARSGIRPEM